MHAGLSLFGLYNPVQHCIEDIYTLYILLLLSILHTQLLLNTRNDKLGQFSIDLMGDNITNILSYFDMCIFVL